MRYPVAFLLILLTAFPCFGLPVPNEDVLKQAMVEDLEEIQRQFEFSYAPVEWKRRYSQWSLVSEVEKAKQAVWETSDMNVKKFHRIVKRLLNSTKDYHVDVVFYQTEAADLPFEVRGVDGHYYLMHIDRTRLPESSFPFQVGDELVSFGGVSTREAVAAIKENDLTQANELTDEALAQDLLTRRAAASGMKVPSGPITLGIRPRDSEQVKQQQLIWGYRGEAFRNHLSVYQNQGTGERETKYFKSGSQLPLLRRQKMGLIRPTEKRIAMNESPVQLGSRDGFLPSLGKKIWESDPDNPFHAYIAMTKDRYLIGYLRIPHFVFEEEDTDELATILQWMQDSTDGLILDQTNNFGGSAFFLYGLLSMLTDQPLKTPKHRFRITQDQVADAIYTMQLLTGVSNEADAQNVLGPTLDGYPVTYQTAQFLLNYCRFILKEWNDGKEYTSPYYLYGVDHVNPHPYVQYTQPILVLINELDFSAADFLAAILQDNKRAVLMGQRTAGAGGVVSRAAFPNRLGINFITLTCTLAERMDKNPIENQGVTPEIPYKVTETDLETGFRPYAEEATRQMVGLIQRS